MSEPAPQVATIATVDPLRVRLKGSTADVPVTAGMRMLAGAAELVVGERVLVALVDRSVWLVSA